MSKYLNVLDQVRIAAPCTAEWDAMHGNEQVRACEHCTRQVHNLSALTRRDALKLVAQSGGKLCLRYYQRPDGTPMLLSDKLYRIPHRVSGAAASLFGALLSLSATANANAAANLRPDTNAPHAAIARSLATHGLTGRDTSDTKRPAISAVQGMMIMRRASIPLVKAASGNDLPEVAKLLASGLVNVNELDRATDMTALMEAVRNGNREMVLALLHAGAQVNQRSKENETALMYLNDDATPELVQDLLSFGAKINAKDKAGRTVLLAVANGVTPEVLRVMLQAGANIEARDAEGRTPLMLAAATGNTVKSAKILRILLAAGADARAVDKEGCTVLHHLAATATPEILKMLFHAGADVNARDHDGTTLLHNAARYSKADALAAVVLAGADLDAADNEGTTALMEAAGHGDVENLRVLLEAGAKPNLRNKEGQTALGLADKEENPEAVQLLVRYGALE